MDSVFFFFFFFFCPVTVRMSLCLCEPDLYCKNGIMLYVLVFCFLIHSEVFVTELYGRLLLLSLRLYGGGFVDIFTGQNHSEMLIKFNE